MDIVIDIAMSAPDMRGLELNPTGLKELDLVAEGRTALLEDRIEDAIASLEQAIRAEPDDVQAHNWLGIALSRKGLYERSTEAFARAVQLAPANERYWFNLGTAYQSGGHPMRAGRYYQVALRLSPDYGRARAALNGLQSAYPNLPLPAVPSAGTPAQILEELERELESLQAPVENEFGVAGATPSPHVAPGSSAPTADWAILDQPKSRFPSLLTRATAALIDLCVIQVLAIAAIIVVALGSMIWQPMRESGFKILAGLIFALIYVAAMTFRKGQTLGKMAMRIQVVDREGHVPGPARAILRTLMGLVTIYYAALWLTYWLAPNLSYFPQGWAVLGRENHVHNLAPVVIVAAIGVGFLWLAIDRRRQSLSDRLAGTFVVGRKLDPSSAVPWISGLLVVNGLLYSFLRVQFMS